MKTYIVKNYKGNLVESLKRFSDSHKGMKIVEACEDEDCLKIKAEESEKVEEDNNEYLQKEPTVNNLIDWLTKFKQKYPNLANEEIIVREEWEDGVCTPYIYSEHKHVELGFSLRLDH